MKSQLAILLLAMATPPTSYEKKTAENLALADAFVKLARGDGYNDDQIVGMLQEAGIAKTETRTTLSGAIQKALNSPGAAPAAALIAAEVRDGKLHARVEKARKGQQLCNDDLTAHLRKTRDERLHGPDETGVRKSIKGI